MRRKARPERWRVTLRADRGGTPLPLRTRRPWGLGLVLGACFAIFAAVWWVQVRSAWSHDVATVFDLAFILFQGFWVLGWSVGVVILGALLALVLLHGESARVRDGVLIHAPRLGPLRFRCEYDLAKVQNLRLRPQRSQPVDTARVEFDYGGRGTVTLGDQLPRADAERLVDALRRAGAGAAPAAMTEPEPSPVHRPPGPAPVPSPAAPLPSLGSPSSLVLIAANLLPLAGVLFLGWDLGDVMVLFWSESGVVGFYTVLKMAVIGRWVALLAVPFFLGHFGGFMSMHFLLMYGFFLGDEAGRGAGLGPGAALAELFVPLRLALLALVVSHGVSFVTNFLGRREYAGRTLSAQMREPYKRVMVMQVTIIFGGWMAMLLGSPLPALALLIALKTAVDLRAHLSEHSRAPARG